MIQDNGKGIRFRDRGRIFSPHYSGKNREDELGLGLPYVYKVIRGAFGTDQDRQQIRGIYVSISSPAHEREERPVAQ